MNKLSLYAAGILMGTALVACDDYKEPNPPAQSNPQYSTLQVSDITEATIVGNDVYDLKTMYDEEKNLDIAPVTCAKLAPGYTFGGLGYVSTDDFETSYLVTMYSTKSEDADMWTLYVLPNELNSVYRENITLMNDNATLKFRFNITTVYETEQGNQVAVIGGPNAYYGPYNITIMPIPEEKIVFDYLYTPGQYNNWSQADSQRLYTFAGDLHYVEYKGFAVLESIYKYTSSLDWNVGINFGAGEEEGTLSTDDDADNLTVGQTGLYYNFVNVDELTYSTYYVTTIGLIGDATPGGWNDSTPLMSEDYLIWTGDVYLVPGGYKFRCNDEWVVDLGGSPNELEFGTNGAGNIEFDGEEGTYTVTLNLTTLPYTCTLVKK